MNKENKMKMENGELKMENGNNSQLSILNSQLNNVEWKTLGEVAELSNIGVDKKKVAGEKEVKL
ncbi:MAG TPA: hypothetical protein PKI48_08560, partial [Chitinophagales bacterium]|nr:hypothetical protein [Chitinophagales bacterium]